MTRWDRALIRRVARVGSGHTPSRSRTDYWSGERTIPWLTTGDVFKLRDGRRSVLSETEEMITAEGLANSSATIHPTGTVAMSRTASVGFTCIMGRPMATSQDWVTWTCGDRILPKFLLWGIRGDMSRVLSRMKGSTHQTIYMDELRELSVPLPPLEEQQHVADFLDMETERIDMLIAGYAHQIELVEEELKSSLSSTVDDLSEIWPHRKLGHVATICEGQVDPRNPPYSEMILIAPNHIERGTGQLGALETASEQGAISGKYLCARGDVIYSKIRPHLAKAAIAPVDCLTSADMYPLRCTPEIEPGYLALYLLSERFTSEAVLNSERVAMPKINRERLLRMRLPLPSLCVQREVTEAISLHQDSSRRVVKELESQIRHLSEYRQALITLAVTEGVEACKAVT